jgi:hypothetical protein
MTLKEIRERARKVGLKNITRYRKESLIKAIQEMEGNSPCFKAIKPCGEGECLWRQECQDQEAAA